jgi:hypothetical protein
MAYIQGEGRSQGTLAYNLKRMANILGSARLTLALQNI